MYIELIKGILNSKVSDSIKLDKISKAVLRAEEIENLAIEFAKRDIGHIAVGQVEPLWEHRLEAIEVLKAKERKPGSDLDNDELISHMNGAMEFLKGTIVENGSWEFKGPLNSFIHMERPTGPSRPVSMLCVAPWDVGLCVSTLNDWLGYIGHDGKETVDREALDLLRKGNLYLQKVQLSLGNGGLGDSFRIAGTRSGGPEATGNTLETSIAIACWLQSSPSLKESFYEPVSRGIDYLERYRKRNGGWGFKPSMESDVKSTSMAVMAIMLSIISKMRLEPGDSRIEELWKSAIGGLNWLLKKQNKEDGSWKYKHKSRDDLTSGSFYAIEAMTLARFFLGQLKPGLKSLYDRIDSARSKALRWYETSYRFIGGERDGWGWWEYDESSAVQNTAASLIVLLDTEWLNETSPLARQTMKWLIDTKDADSWWQLDTPLVIKAAVRMLHPPSRLREKLRSLRVQFQ